MQVLHSRASAAAPAADAEAVAKDALSRLHLVRCPSSLALLAALASLEPPARLACVLLDNVAAHLAVDRDARGPGGVDGVGAPLTAQRAATSLARSLRALQRVCGSAPVVATRRCAEGTGGSQRDSTPASWRALVTDRLSLA